MGKGKYNRFQVKPFKTGKHDLPKNPDSDVVGKHPFRTMVVGNSGSGKTVLMLTLLNNFFKDYFDELWLFSPTYGVDDTWDSLDWPEDKVHVVKDFSEDEVQNLLDRQMNDIRRKGILKSKKVLLVADDQINSPQFLNSAVWQSYMTLGRHENVSTLIATQKYNKLPFIWRAQMSNLFIFNSDNEEELETIMNEQKLASLTRRQFRELFLDVTREPYHFLTINKQEARRSHRYRQNLDTPIVIDEQKALSEHPGQRRRAVSQKSRSIKKASSH